MGDTAISWVARPNEHPTGTCKHLRPAGCLDVTCEHCWVMGFTVNPWIGCERVSAACKHCYAADVAANRMGLDVWGKDAPRAIRVDKAWKELRRISRRAVKKDQRLAVFSGSMCDVFEDRPDLIGPRKMYLSAVERARNTDVMLLTKRSHHVLGMVPWPLDQWPKHAWIGVTVEDVREDMKRLPDLRRFKELGATTFVSIEPMIETGPRILEFLPFIDLVIIGGESGHDSRPFDVDGARVIVEQAVAAGVPVWFKQMGSVWAHQHSGALVKGASHGQDPYRWPAWAQLHQLPKVSHAT